MPLCTIRKVTIAIPAFNERRTLPEVVRRVQAVPLPGLEREIIVVNDGSTDGTGELLQDLRGVRAFSHDRNLGKGAALRTAFAAATGDVIIVQDADLELFPEEYPKLLAPILEGRTQVVYGSRTRGVRIGPANPMFFLGGQLITLVANALFGLRLTDEPTCYKVFRTEVVKRMHLRCRRFEFCPEFTAKAALLGFRIVEVPISYRPRTVEDGKKLRWQDGVQAVLTLLYYRFKR